MRIALLIVMIISTVSFAQQETKFLGNIYNGIPDPLFNKYWNQVTPENAGKWGSVEVVRDKMSWSSLDLMFKIAKENNMPVKQHTFIWGQQEPNWMRDLPPEEQRAEVLEWMTSFAERYPDVEYIDVVNEAQHAPPSYKDALGGDGETGWDWIIWSFEQVRELFPNSKLLINDYNILCCTGELEVYKEQIRLLQERELVDGIGIQSHGLETVLPSTIQRNLDSLAELGLPIYVSELELREADDLAQLYLYRDVFPILWQHPSVKGMTLWGYKAGEMWRDTAELINWFDEERPALQWLVKYLEYDRLINGGSR
jgi:endo-1,4-beta-xylanase